MAEVVSKKGKNRKALKAISANDANISAGGLSVILSPEKAKRAISSTKSASQRSLAEELKEVQRRLEQLRIEKEKTEDMLKQRDELIKSKEEELESRAQEQEKLQKELKKLQKMKGFKPTMNLPLVKSLREKEQEKKKKKKKSKDCPENKKPSSAYVLWSKDQWNEIKAEKPDADFKEISIILGSKWKSLSAEDKKPYEEKYMREKEAYLQIVGKEKREKEAMKLLEEEQMQRTAMELLEQYMQFKQEAENEGGKKEKKEKDPLKPKRPMSAFFLYTTERRAALLEEKKNILEISKIAGEEWKSMTEEQKAHYGEIASKHKEEHNSQMELYKQKKLEEAASLEKEEEEQKKVMKQEALQLLKKKEKTENMIKKTKEKKKKEKDEKKSSDPNKPKKPISSFFLFSKETRKELMQERPDIGNSTLTAMISVKWKELSDDERKIWNDKAAEGMAAYKREMEEYNKSLAAAGNTEASTSDQ